MKTASAQLNTYRQSPRKVRLLADLIRGKRVSSALTTLRFANKRATGPFIKLIESAIANAKNAGLKEDSLVVDKVTVNAGQILYRSLPMSRGRAFRMRKRTSHIAVSLAEVEMKPKKSKAKAEAKPKAEKVEKTKTETK